MMRFARINRRVHLYLGVALVPWFLMYGISGLFFSHGAYFARWFEAGGRPQWTVRFDRPYARQVPDGADLPTVAAAILQDAGLEGSFGVYRPNPRRLDLWVFTFRSTTRLTYFLDQQRLLAEDKRFRLDHFFTGMHARAGFAQESLLSDAWGLIVDCVAVGIVVWALSGIYMWWKTRPARFWGGLALAGGVVCFVGLVAGL